jgi:D-alanyl-D-alanine carboxypeptidase (penicillin-binding protein 5/6)
MRRRLKLYAKRALFFGGCLAVLVLVLFLMSRLVAWGIGLIGGGSAQDAVVMSAAEQQSELQSEEETLPRIVVQYPTRSAAYVECTDDKVRSANAIVVDVDNSSIIAGKNSTGRIYPASMTKVMTLIVAVENLKSLDDTFVMTVDITDPLYQENASVAGFLVGETINARDLLYGLILPSGADAAQALARMVAGSEEAFAVLMNKKCTEMGLKETHFVNTSGLHDDNQYTTLTEMAMIMEYAMQDETCAKVLSTYQYTTAVTEQHPEGILLTSTMYSRMYGNEAEGVLITAGKTGYTVEAGNCLVCYAQKGEHAYVVVLAEGTNKWHSIYDAIDICGNYLP